MSKLEATLLTGRTVDQGVALETDKMGNLYVDACAVVEIDPEDMKTLDILTGTIVKVKTDYGEVNVRALLSPNAPHKGIVFVPMGIYANVIVNPDTHSTGTPQYKGIPVTIEPAPRDTIIDPTTMAKNFMK